MAVSAARTIVLPSGQAPSLNAGVIAPGYRWPVAAPGSVLDYSLDLTAPLGDVGDAIAAVTVSAAPSGTGELTIQRLAFAGTVMTAWLGAGPAGRNYAVQVGIATQGGRTLDYQVGLLVDPANAALSPPVSNPAFGAAFTWPPGELALDFTVPLSTSLAAAL